MASDKNQKSKESFSNKSPEGRKWRHGGAYPAGASYITKEGRRLASLPRRSPR
jgi:hypothetical protein